MSRWTKETALQELHNLIGEIDSLTIVRRHSSNHTRWLARTLRVLEEVFGEESRYYLSIAHLTWSEAGNFVVQTYGDPAGAIDRRHQQAYVHQLDMAHGLLLAAVDELEGSGMDDVYKGKDTPQESSAIMKVLSLVEQKLRKTIREVPQREREVQDALENLLIGADIPYSRETESIEYSSKTYIPDFTLPRIDLALEVKFSSRPTREKELIGEINDDILAYKTKFRNLLFVVYDTGQVRDVERFVGHFEQHDGVLVRIVKH